MGGGLMQLVAYGAQDIYLTGNPQITFFKVVYRRHTNFAMEVIQQTINGTSVVATSATTGTVTISRNGDLVGRVYVRCDQDTSDGINGDKLITDVTLEIGGQQIDKHTSEWLQVYAELTTPASKADAYKYLTGGFSNELIPAADGATLTTYNPETLQQSVMVPLQFFFCRNPGLALPLIALQYHEVKLKFTWGTDVATKGTGVSRDGTTGGTPTVEVWADYYYLDTDERRRFAQVSHEYLIEQLQYQTEGTANTSYKLNFNHPVKELIWTTDNPHDTAEGSTVISQKVKLQLNGHDRFAQQDREYFQIRQPLDHHTSVPGFNIKEVDDPVMVAPIDTTVLTHNATVATTAAKLEATQITFHEDCVAAANATAGTAVRNGDILRIVVGGEDGDSIAAAEVMSHIVQIKSVSDDSNPVCVFATAIPAAQIFTKLVDDDGMNVTIIGRTQNPRSRCSQLLRDVNVYSFALKPEEHQPSGTCNFSRIDNAKLVLSASGLIQNIYAVNYNVLRIMSGMGGMAYSN
ncbi:MAG: hypothetical protein CMI53_04315 [Parcubacteria group bacterium]|nr:hypothetical protein [Parcubacteria group bacterium]